MAKYNFDRIIDRSNTGSIKYDYLMRIKKRDDLLPLWVADMDFELPGEIIEDIKKRCDHGIFGYTDLGNAYIEPVKKWFKERHGFEFENDQLTVTAGVIFSLSLSINAFTRPGDAVIIQRPVYRPFFETIELNDRRVVDSPLIYQNGRYEIDFDDFEKKVIDEKVKLFVICSPHNPVGRVWTKEELTRLSDICKRHGVYIFSDEIHAEFMRKGRDHVSLMNLGSEYLDNIIVSTSTSKAFNLAGIQVANVIIPNEEMRKAFRKQNLKTGYKQPNVLGMIATMSAYEKGGEWLDELNAYIDDNLDYVRSFLAEKLPKVKLVEPEGTYLIWLDFSEVTDDAKFLDEIITDKAKLFLEPGWYFGKDTDVFYRVNIACPRSVLEEAFNRLYTAITEYC